LKVAPLPISPALSLGLNASSQRERRARFSVGLGCPSFGGQRTVGGCFSVPVTERQGRQAFLAGSELNNAFGHRQSLGRELLLARFCRFGCLAETASTPVRQSRAPVCQVASSRLSRPWALGQFITVGASPVPNPSVKGTSCGKPQAAPYVER
jgi:hypothetical protein